MDEGTGTSVANDIGTVDITLDGATWASDPTYYNGEATSYDGIDDSFYTTSTDSWNDQEYSFASWFKIDNNDGAAVLATASNTQNSGGIPDNGWQLLISAGPELRLLHANSGTLNDVYRDTFSNTGISYGNWYFMAFSANGDNADFYIWDTNAQILNISATAGRGVGGNKYITGMERYGLDRNVEGLVDTPFASRTTALTESEFQQLYDLTNR